MAVKIKMVDGTVHTTTRHTWKQAVAAYNANIALVIGGPGDPGSGLPTEITVQPNAIRSIKEAR